MIRVTIIDDRIENERLSYPAVTEHLSYLTEKEKDQEKPGHGTWIAQILLRYAKTPVCITNLQILYDADVPVNLDRLTEVLKWCAEHETPDIIMISAASIDLYEEQELHEAIRCNAARGTVILAAGDNRQYRAVPACYPEVIGVCCDKKKRLEPGTCAVLKGDPLGIDVIANCDNEESEEEACHSKNKETDTNDEAKEIPSNSYAVPVAAATVCGFLENGIKEKGEILRKLELMSGRYIDQMDYVLPKAAQDEQVRIRFITGKKLTADSYISLARECHDRYGYDTLIIGSEDNDTAPYVIDWKKLDHWGKELTVFLQRHYQTEMVWWLEKEQNEEESTHEKGKTKQNGKDCFAEDMVVAEIDNGIQISCEDGVTECEFGALLETMIAYLMTENEDE